MKTFAPYIIIVVLILLLFNQCNESKRISTDNYEALNDTVSYYKNRLGKQTATIKTLQAHNEKKAVALLGKDKEIAALVKEFKQVKYITKYETVAKYDTILVAFDNPVPALDFTRTGLLKKKHISFNYKIDNFSFSLDSLNIPNTTTIITGTKRKWFLGKEYLTTDITNSNPYITVTDIKSVEIAVPTPWYKKWYVWAGAGLIGGIVISQ